MLAVALTSLLLLVLDPGGAAATGPATERGSAAGLLARAEPADREPSPAANADANEVAKATAEEAKSTFGELREAALANLPKLALAVLLLLLAWVVVRALRFVLRKALGNWPRSSALIAIVGIGVWVLAGGLAVTVIAGDFRAFLGSVGLLGLAASWALQTPIESFTGWLLNAFRGYYRVGDRIEVGDVFGDVYRIGVLTTTVWEIASALRPGPIHAEQPTGRYITFPNNQILTGSVVNLTGDFPYVWDELTVAVANESSLRYAADVVRACAARLLGDGMQEPARQYELILQKAGLVNSVPTEPEVFVSVEDSWTNLHVRYLVHVRERRGYKSELILRLSEDLARPEHATKIIPVMPRQQLQLIGSDGIARNAEWFRPPRSPDAQDE